jgi:hypothetical protein
MERSEQARPPVTPAEAALAEAPTLVDPKPDPRKK